jgi:hypothetical protein
MNIQLKPMKLLVKKLDDTKYKRTITDLNGNVIWEDKEQWYVYNGDIVMDAQRMDDLINQMKRVSFWNIVEVENDFA